jgi:hypothetical protein
MKMPTAVAGAGGRAERSPRGESKQRSGAHNDNVWLRAELSWITNEEYASQVLFCPVCGKAAPNRELGEAAR